MQNGRPNGIKNLCKIHKKASWGRPGPIVTALGWRSAAGRNLLKNHIQKRCLRNGVRFFGLGRARHARGIMGAGARMGGEEIYKPPRFLAIVITWLFDHAHAPSGVRQMFFDAKIVEKRCPNRSKNQGFINLCA